MDANDVLARVQRRLADEPAPPSPARLVDIIRDSDDKYPEPDAPREKAKKKNSAPPSNMPTLVEATDEPQPLEAQVEAALKTLQFLLRERLSVSEYALLRMGMIVGQPDPQEVTRLASRAKVDGSLDAFTADLLQHLGHLQMAQPDTA